MCVCVMDALVVLVMCVCCVYVWPYTLTPPRRSYSLHPSTPSPHPHSTHYTFHHQDQPAAVRTRLFGIAESCLWAGMLAGPLVGGALAEGYPYIGGGIQQSFVFSVLMFGLALFVAVCVVR